MLEINQFKTENIYATKTPYQVIVPNSIGEYG